MPDDFRVRRTTTPPVPPSDGHARLVLVEHKVADIQEDLHRLREAVESINLNLTVLVTQKKDAEAAAEKDHRKLEKWKTGGITILVTVCIGIIGVLAKIAIVMQSAKVLPPP